MSVGVSRGGRSSNGRISLHEDGMSVKRKNGSRVRLADIKDALC